MSWHQPLAVRMGRTWAGETALSVKHWPPCKHKVPSSEPQNLHKRADMVAHACNPSTSVLSLRRGSETGESLCGGLKSNGPHRLVYLDTQSSGKDTI